VSRGRLLLAAAIALGGAIAARTAGMQLPIPYDYGHVKLENFTVRARVPPVRFDHWRHRSQFTCRLCHVDVGFAMTAGATQVSSSTIRDGFHCGACHDGKRTWRGKPIFAACGDARRFDAKGSCGRCHREVDEAAARRDFEPFARNFPRDRFGLVDWEKAERSGLVRPVDFLEGISIPRDPLKNPKVVTIVSKGEWMSDVLFSHPKHATWNGCEVCHPEIFPNAGGQARRYTMLDISSGGACGACHDKVAFPLADCEKCHVKPVR
jgi:c(7)-type cytochrome triheme protein